MKDKNQEIKDRECKRLAEIHKKINIKHKRMLRILYVVFVIIVVIYCTFYYVCFTKK